MGLINIIKGWWNSLFISDAEKVFGVDIAENTMMDVKTDEWLHIYRGFPMWVDEKIKTIKMAKAVCSETARLATLAIDIAFDGGARADWLNKQCYKLIMPRLRNWIEYGCAAGTILLKPTETGIDMYLPGQFYVINSQNGVITDIVFQDTYTTKESSKDIYYTKLERHNYYTARVRMNESEEYEEKTFYKVESHAFKSSSDSSLGKEVELKSTQWAGIEPVVYIAKQNDDVLNNMLFGTFKTPAANDIDFTSPLGMSIFSDAIEELKDLDVAYSRNAEEIFDSETIELIGGMMLNNPGEKVRDRTTAGLPHHVHMVNSDKEQYYQAIERPLNPDERIKGINNQLSFIGYKCGYSNGYFVFDQKTGMVTATQVEADDRRTIQLIKDIRDSLENCLNELFYAMSVFADLYSLAPVGEYETDFSFGDITYNFEEDRAHFYNLATQGKFPWEEYYVKFLKYSHEEARELLTQAKNENSAQGFEYEEDAV